MKTLKIATALLIALCSMSCLEHGFDNIETYTGNDIQSVAGVYYRYYGTDTNPGSGETKVNQVTMSYSSTVDQENGTVVCSVAVPSGFPESQLYNVSLAYNKGDRQGLLVTVNLSTAATIKPLDGAPKLGEPGDWSKPNRYLVTAANGDTKEWTITLETPDEVYNIDNDVAEYYYGYAIYSRSAGTWRFGYTPNNQKMLYLTFKSTTGDENTPPSGTLTLSNVTAATWGGAPVTLKECNLTITPDEGGWDGGWCNYKMVGKVVGASNSLSTLTVNFTADGTLPSEGNRSFGWIGLQVAD